jgi:hypothetical protein
MHVQMLVPVGVVALLFGVGIALAALVAKEPDTVKAGVIFAAIVVSIALALLALGFWGSS